MDVQAAAINLVLPRDGVRLTIGRHAGCDVVFTDPSVSRLHASLRRELAAWTVHDLGSTNGTWLNGSRVDVRRVVAGDELRLGVITTRLV